MSAFDIVVSPVGSKFAKELQKELTTLVKPKVYRRLTPKVVAPRRALLSRRGNVLRAARPGYTRPHFLVTQRPLNKIEQFHSFVRHEVSCPGFALSEATARNLQSKTIFARTLINATSGRGIVEFERGDEQYPRAPLYTEYIPKKAEYRIHVFGQEVIDAQEKRKKRGFEDARDTRVRNVHNGYVYCRDGLTPPDGIGELAIKAVQACGYLYGAVDIIYNEKQNKCFVLEVNSRPGLMGTTLKNYSAAIVKYFNLEKK